MHNKSCDVVFSKWRIFQLFKFKEPAAIFNNFDLISSTLLNLTNYTQSSLRSFVLGLGLKHFVSKWHVRLKVVSESLISCLVIFYHLNHLAVI